MHPRPTSLFVPVAVALGHLLGYVVAHPDPASRSLALAGHGHLGPMVAVGTAAALVGLVRVAVAARRGEEVRLRYDVLVAAGLAGYATLESLERLVHGTLGTLLAEPGLWWGLALQAVVAALLVVLARVAGVVGGALAPAIEVPGPPRRPRRRPSVPPWPPVLGWRSVSPTRRRGPPLLA